MPAKSTGARRVAVLFDDAQRPETTGVYVRRALADLAEVTHVRPAEAARLAPADFDLFLRVDDGFDLALPPALRPAALWAIDTHLDPQKYLAAAPAYDWVFAAQQPGAELLRRHGADAAW